MRALTGIEPDRLKEEKRRGISIDLGFAHLELEPGLRAGFVDVPGHERFVKNMLAGAGGIDLVLLVIAADESIKPQTREHFDICRLLGLRSGLIVLNKADLVDNDILELVRLEAEEFVAGSFLEGAPMIAVSSKTGQGLDQLKTALAIAAKQVSTKNPAGHLRLPVDRSFVMKGFGTIVTGTLISGTVSLDQEVGVQPGGQRLRVRGVQVHGETASKASAGQRTALNLAGTEATDLGRGMTLVEPGVLQSTQVVDCEFDLLTSAKTLKNRAPVHFHAWTAETEAEIRVFGAESIAPGSRVLARFLLHTPVQLLPGDRFIVRMFSPVITIGGGRIVDIDPPARRKRAQTTERLRLLANASDQDRVALLVRESTTGSSVSALVARTGLSARAVEAAARAAKLIVLADPQPWLLDPTWIARQASALQAMLETFHRQNPLLPGISREEARSRLFADVPPFVLETVLRQARTIVAEGEILRLASHQLHLKQDEEQALAKIEVAFEKGGLAVPALQEVLAASGVEVARARSLLQILFRQKRLIRVSDDLVYHPTAISALKELLAAHKGERFAVPVFKDWTSVSRKYAIPLLEFLDRERVTRRDGDERVVL